MIRLLRSRALLVLSVLSVGIGLALGAAAQGTVEITNVSQPVTQREFYTVLASGFVLVVLGTAGAVKLMFSSALRDLRDGVADLRSAVAKFEDRQYNHNESASAHTVALVPVHEKIERLKQDLSDAVEECLGHRTKRRSTDPHAGGPNDSGPVYTDTLERAE